MKLQATKYLRVLPIALAAAVFSIGASAQDKRVGAGVDAPPTHGDANAAKPAATEKVLPAGTDKATAAKKAKEGERIGSGVDAPATHGDADPAKPGSKDKVLPRGTDKPTAAEKAKPGETIGAGVDAPASHGGAKSPK